jgi:Fe-S cluster assembly protein SufD
VAFSSSSDIAKKLCLDEGLSANSGQWIENARLSAAKRVEDQGLPKRRDEYWNYTKPDAFLQKKIGKDSVKNKIFDIFSSDLSTIINYKDGVLKEKILPVIPGCSIESLQDAAKLDEHWAGAVFGVLEAAGQIPVKRSMAALNTATASQGLLFLVSGKVKTPIKIDAVSIGSVDANVHHVVKVKPGAEVTLIETGQYGAGANVVLEVEVEENGVFHHIRVQDGQQQNSLTHIFGRLGANSTFKSFTLSMGGSVIRNECILELVGDTSSATIAGACIGDDKFHHDDTVFVTHSAPNCESRQVFKKVLRDGAVGVFQGKILVKEGAQKTDGYQISQSLLLDDNCQFLAKPELEIYADDVVCSHGSTSGAIDEDALFYLRSRGVPKSKAVDLLTLSFVAESIEEVEDPDLADDLLRYLTAFLEVR